MRIQRAKNAKRNIIYGTILKIYQIIVPFLMRTLMIYQMGLEYAGLNNLFMSIFQVLNLAELGIGAALTFSMYEPIAQNDKRQICALLNMYKKCFQIIGLVILGLGLFCVPALKYLVSGTIPHDTNIYILYLLYLSNTVLSYWMFSYKKSLIYAHQRTDINSKIALFTSTIQYALQIFVLVVLHNYYLYIVSSIISQMLLNLISAIVVKKIYLYKPEGSVDSGKVNSIKKKVQGLITNKIGGVILRSADSIVVSAFFGLSMLALYQNYFFILTAIISVVAIVFESCVAGIGNSLVTENKEKNYEDFCVMTFLVGWLVGVCCACFVCLYQNFMAIWVGKDNLLAFPLMISFVVYFFVYEIEQLIATYKDAAGIWYEDRYRPLITALVNLILNVSTVKIFGLYGILYSTIVSILVVGMPWLLYNIYHTLFKGMIVKRYLNLLLKILISTVFGSFVSYLICSQIHIGGILGLIICLIAVVIISNLCQTALLFRCKEFNSAIVLLKRMFTRKEGKRQVGPFHS